MHRGVCRHVVMIAVGSDGSRITLRRYYRTAKADTAVARAMMISEDAAR